MHGEGVVGGADAKHVAETEHHTNFWDSLLLDLSNGIPTGCCNMYKNQHHPHQWSRERNLSGIIGQMWVGK